MSRGEVKGNSQSVRVARMANGLTVLGEEMSHASSAALSILIPSGAATDPVGSEGMASVLGEMLNKGAGRWETRELSEQFEQLGAHYGHSAGVEVTVVSCVLLSENLEPALDLLATVLLEPRLPADELESVRQLALQQLKSLEDEPSSKVMVELARDFYPFPFGRSQFGTVEGLQSIGIESLRNYFRTRYVPGQAIVAIAGRFSWDQVLRRIERRFGSWQGEGEPLIEPEFRAAGSVRNISRETNQVQIALGFRSIPLAHPDYYMARVGVGVLSGPMAGRLFVEVREKRGLVYHVSASHSAARGRAAIFAYAGTTPEHADETLTVILSELRKLREGVTDEELQRAKAELKARVIMQGELSSSRASILVNDWWNLKRVRPIEEIRAAVDRVASRDIERHFGEFPVENVTLVTLGPKSLTPAS